MNILITGGAGFIGSNLSEHFSRNHRVTLYDSLSRSGSEKNLNWLASLKRPNLKVVVGDINDRQKLSKLIRNQDIILHLAAQVAVTNSVADPETDFRINLAGTFGLLEEIRKSGQKPLLVYSSTNKVYGDLDMAQSIEGREAKFSKRCRVNTVPVDEQHPLDFYSPYACSKGAADSYVHDYFRIYGIPTVVLRKSCIYGVRQFGTEDQGWVAHFVRHAVSGVPITIYGNGRQIRDLLYITDLIGFYDKLVKSPQKARGLVFNLGGGQGNATDLLGLLAKLEKILGAKIKIDFQATRPGDQPYFVSDITRAGRVFGWKPKVNIDAGLKALVKWVENEKA